MAEACFSNALLCVSVLLHQLLRKRHIGNDIVTIVFQEPGALPFTPKSIRSHFQHVFIIVQVHEPCTDKTYYRSVDAVLNACIFFTASLSCLYKLKSAEIFKLLSTGSSLLQE